MAQGGFKSSTAKGKGGKPPAKKAATGKSAPVKAKAGLGRVGGKHGMKKGSFVVAPKQADALKAHKKAEVITKAINKQVCSAVRSHQEQLVVQTACAHLAVCTQNCSTPCCSDA
jgi:hypothetical protein